MKKSKEKIGIDIDDVVIDFVSCFVAYHNRVYGTEVERHHFTTWHMHEVLGCDEEEATRRGIEFYHSEDHMKLTAVPGSLPALQILSTKYELIGITARESVRAERMLQVLKGHFGGLLCDKKPRALHGNAVAV